MTARADRLTKRANPPDRAGSVPSSDPASTVRVFVDALERLDYRMEPCWPTPVSFERILVTRTRAYRVRSGSRCFAERWKSAR